jgi:beta-glucosidase
MSVPSTPAATRDDAEVAGRVDALIARMTVAEKAGQLTQYFHFDLPPSADGEADGEADTPGAALPGLADAVEAALARGEVGSLLFVTDPASGSCSGST